MPKSPKSRCKFGHNDTCDGINGTSGFVCRECVEDDYFNTLEQFDELLKNGQPEPAKEGK